MYDEELQDEQEIIQAASRLDDLLQFCAFPVQSQSLSQSLSLSPSQHLFSKRSVELPMRLKLKMMSTLEANMKTYYSRTSWGWNDAELHKETFHTLNRFLVVSRTASFDQLVEDVEANLLGFVAFRFDWDDEDEPEYPVLYLYQLQIVQSAQRTGLGKLLMDMVRSVAEHTRMRKVILTCFKINTSAMEFYKRIGFSIDSNSPSTCGYSGEPYEILSVSCRK